MKNTLKNFALSAPVVAAVLVVALSGLTAVAAGPGANPPDGNVNAAFFSVKVGTALTLSKFGIANPNMGYPVNMSDADGLLLNGPLLGAAGTPVTVQHTDGFQYVDATTGNTNFKVGTDGSLSNPGPGNFGFLTTKDSLWVQGDEGINGNLVAVNGTFSGNLGAVNGAFSGHVSAAGGVGFYFDNPGNDIFLAPGQKKVGLVQCPAPYATVFCETWWKEGIAGRVSRAVRGNVANEALYGTDYCYFEVENDRGVNLTFGTEALCYNPGG